MNKRKPSGAWTIAGLTAPAYLWLTLTIFLPLSAMLYFSFLTVAPMGGKEASFTLEHYTASSKSTSTGTTPGVRSSSGSM